MKAGDKLWQPWTPEEREYFKGVRTIFAHARCSVLGSGALRVRDKYHRAPGKPEIDGFHFDKSTSDWEWSAREFQEFSQRLEKLIFQRFQCYFLATVTCQTCGQSVECPDYLACGHVKYPEGSQGAIISKPAGGTLEVTSLFGYQDNMEDRFADSGKKAVITYDGLDLIISSMEAIDRIASEEAKKGTPIYTVQPD